MEQTTGVYENTIFETLGIREVEAHKERVVLELDVTPAVHQPMGLLHGGASAVLAESAASMAAWLNCPPGSYPLGIELNISHLRARRSGTITAVATPIRRGQTLQVWSVDITDENGKAVAVARCSLVVRDASEQERS